MISAADKERWQARRLAIYQHWLRSDSLTETGKAFGITRERVRQIVKREKNPDGENQPGGSDPTPAVGAGQRG